MKIKIHKTYRTVVSVCDSDILGKCFEEDGNLLDVRENFYNGEEIEEEALIEQLIDLAREDATFNIAGKQSVQAALKAGIIDKEGIKTIQNIPFALVLI